MKKIENEISNDIVIYESKEGDISFNVNVFAETVWLNQKNMAELFGASTDNISLHMKNIYEEGELDELATTEDFSVVQIEGKRNVRRIIRFYNLDAIIAVGYRVSSRRATQFRQWATKVLKQYLFNGYAVNEIRIKKIEESLDELIASQKLLKGDAKEIKDVLLKLVERPIVIQNNHQINNKIGLGNELERKLVKLLDQVILGFAEDKKEIDEKTKAKFEKAKKDVLNLSKKAKSEKSKKSLFGFFKEVADENSDLSKAIKGVGVARKLVSEIIEIGEKLRGLF